MRGTTVETEPPVPKKFERDARALKALRRVLLGIGLLAFFHPLSLGPWKYCLIRDWLPFSFDSAKEVEIWLYAPEEDFMQSIIPWLGPIQMAYLGYLEMCTKAGWDHRLRE